MDLSLAVWGDSLREFADVATRAESAGFDGVWASELHRSSWVQATVLATATDSIRVGTAVVLAFPRSAMVTALSALDLDDLSRGRFILGIGPGVRGLNERWHGVDFAPVRPRFTERIGTIRTIIEQAHLDEPIRIEGDYESIAIDHFRRPWKPTRPTIPIIGAAVGPRMARVAGAIADGWVGHVLGSADYIDQVLQPEFDAGRNGAGRTSEFRRIAGVCCVIDDDEASAVRRAAHAVTFYASVGAYRPFFAWHGFEDEFDILRGLMREGRRDDALAECSTDLVHALTLVGNAKTVRAGLDRYASVVEEVKLNAPTYGLPGNVTRATQNELIAFVGVKGIR